MVGNIYKNKIRIRYLGISLVLPDLVDNVGEGKCFPQVVPADDTTNLGIKGTIKLNFGFFFDGYQLEGILQDLPCY